MKIDLYAFDSVERAEALVRKCLDQLGLQGEFQPRLHWGVNHALTESVRGLMSIFSHRRHFACLLESSPYLEPLTQMISKEGMIRQDMKLNDLDEPQAFLENLKKDTLFVIWADDDPLFARSFDGHKLETLLSEKKIFSIRLSHSSHSFKIGEILPYSVRIFSMSSLFSATALGVRVRGEPLICGSPPLTEDLIQHLELITSSDTPKKSEDRDAILGFEDRGLAGFRPLLSKDTPRLFDRAVIYRPDIDGSAVIEHLMRTLKTNSNLRIRDHELFKFLECDSQLELSQRRALETSSSCRWGLRSLSPWLLACGFPPDVIRGTIIIDVGLLFNDWIHEFESVFNNVVSEILEIQG